MKTFKEYLNEARGKEFFTGSGSSVAAGDTTGTSIFKFKLLGLDTHLEQPARQSIEEPDKIETGDVIIGVTGEGKKKIGKVLRIIKNSQGMPVSFEISTKQGTSVKVDASKVTKKDYHGEKTNKPFDSSRVIESFQTYISKLTNR